MTKILSGIQRLNLALGALSGLLVLGLVIAVAPDVAARTFFGVSIHGASEGSALLLVIIVFLGLAGAQAQREHFRIVVVEEQLSGRWFRVLTILRIVICVLTAAALSWYAIRGAYGATLRQEMSYAVIAFPLWPARIVVAVGFVLLTLQYIVDLVGEVTGNNKERTVSLPGEGIL